MIEVNNLVKKYGNHVAVDGLNFRIEPGRIYGFLGPNGAGKSTTMNIMTGYLGATSGSVLIDGHDILKEPEEAKKHIGYLPELPPLYMEMTVTEYLDFAAELKKIPGKERKDQVEKVIRMAKLREVEDRLIANLSKGYRQRVGLAQAILGFPEIIILDEPTVGLDPRQIIEIRTLIRNLAKDHTIILSSHILAEIKEVCDYIIIISNGKIVASDTLENLEKNASGRRHIELQTRVAVDKVQSVLKTVPGIRNAKYSIGPEHTTWVEIETRNSADIREEIFKVCVRNNIPLLTLMMTKSTLEEVFLDLTQGNGKTMISEEAQANNAASENTSGEMPEETAEETKKGSLKSLFAGKFSKKDVDKIVENAAETADVKLNDVTEESADKVAEESGQEMNQAEKVQDSGEED